MAGLIFRRSSNVHLTALTLLRDYFRKRRALRIVRLCGMVTLLVLLCVAFVPTTSYNWVAAATLKLDRQHYPPGDPSVASNYSLNFAIPSKCFWGEPFNGRGPWIDWSRTPSRLNPDVPFAYTILLGTYIWKAIEIFRQPKPSSVPPHGERDLRILPQPSWIKRMTLGRLARNARTTAIRIEALLQADHKDGGTTSTTPQTYGRYVLFKLRLTTYGSLLVIFDFLTSFVASLWALLILSVWGTISVAYIRNKSTREVHREECSWNFGQTLPTLLLAAPFLAMLNHFMRKLSVVISLNTESFNCLPCRRR